MKFAQAPELTKEDLVKAWTDAWGALPDAWIADPEQSHQFADYHSQRMAEWLSAFSQGIMRDTGHMTLMLQGVLEAGMGMGLDVATFRCVSHFVNMGLCTINGRSLQ